ncbi:hypothetical protein R6Q57_023595 [Mikania cordata]
MKEAGSCRGCSESEFVAPTITKLIPIPFSTSGASVAYNVNPVADQFQRAFQTSTFCNRLYSFFNKRWFFDQVFNDFLVRSFLRFGYEVSFEALDKGAIEILGPYGAELEEAMKSDDEFLRGKRKEKVRFHDFIYIESLENSLYSHDSIQIH